MIKFLLNLKEISSFNRIFIIAICDFFIFNLAFWLSYALRDTFFFFPTKNQFFHLLIGNFIYFFLYIRFKIFNYLLRFFDLDYIKTFLKFLIIFFIIFFIVTLILNFKTVQRSSPATISIFCFGLIVVSRFIIFNLINYSTSFTKKNIAIIGSGNLAINFLNSSKYNSVYKTNFLFSNNKNLIGRSISTIAIRDLKNIFKVIQDHKIEEIIIATNTVSLKEIRKIIARLKKMNIPVSYFNNNILVPQIFNLSKSSHILPSHDINFFHEENIKNFKNKTIFISGAGGSIGSELSRQLLLFKPKKIILFDISEYNLFSINQDLDRLKNKKTLIIPILGDICNYVQIDSIFKKYKPSFVFHAAAIKHVKIAEENIFSAINTNIFGTYNLLTAMRKYDEIKKFILISTDKAVRPINVMGLTKRFAELLLLNEQSYVKKKCYSAVRFGNVANSSGSVLPIWKKQLENNEKLTITNPNATRFLMSITEAVNLVLDASILGKGGEIFVLDMGEPIKIFEILKLFLKSYNLKPKSKKYPHGVNFIVTGLKKGEKKHEKLFYNKNYTRTKNNNIYNSNEKIRISSLMLKKTLKEIRINLNLNLDLLAVKKIKKIIKFK